jgi:hypothetical protein
MILTYGEWKESPYFFAVENGFAVACLDAGGLAASEKDTAKASALRAIARGAVERRARVAAAAAIIDVDPELAKTILAKEYADFSLGSYVDLIGPPRPETPPQSAGEYLQKLGVDVVAEITSLGEFWELIVEHDRASGSQTEAEADVCLLAVDRLNLYLRATFLAGRQHEFFLDRSALAQLAFDCLIAEIESPTPPPAPFMAE